jgi:hypothetical protein
MGLGGVKETDWLPWISRLCLMIIVIRKFREVRHIISARGGCIRIIIRDEMCRRRCVLGTSR